MAIDYAAAKREHPKLKAMLTRAGKDPVKVKAACRAAIAAWERWGAWPDDWSRWQRALDDSMPFPKRAPRLEELQFNDNPAGKPRRSTSLAGLEPSKKWRRRCPFCSAKTNIDRLSSSSRTWQQWQCPECGKWVDRRIKPLRRSKLRGNPGLGMPGMPHTWVTKNGVHVSGGDLIEFRVWDRGVGSPFRDVRGTVNRMLVFDDHVMVNRGTMGTYVDDENFIRVVRRAKRKNPSLGAQVWARELHGKDATNFGLLRIGQRFRFPSTPKLTPHGTPNVMVKTGKAWYRDMLSKRWRTSPGAAVIPYRES